MSHFHYSNMPIREEYRLNGTILPSSIEQLLEKSEKLEKIQNDSTVEALDALISEAQGCFLEEDCLDEVIDDIRILADRSRSNKSTLLNIIVKLEALQNEITSSSEYGYDELKKAKKLISPLLSNDE